MVQVEGTSGGGESLSAEASMIGMSTAPNPSTRVAAIDLARGTAILGMVSAHVLGATPLTWDPSTWYGIFDGRTTILFFLLAGLSTGLITGGPEQLRPVDLLHKRLALAARAACVYGIGLALQGASVIGPFLQIHATLFVLAQLFLRMRAQQLIITALVAAVAVPQLVQSVPFTFEWGQPEAMTGFLGALVMLAPFLTGLALARGASWNPKAGRHLLLIGLGAAVLSYTASGLALALTAGSDGAHHFLDASGHTGTTFELVGATGTGLMVLGAWLQVRPHAARVFSPVAALGSMPLTMVVLHAGLTDTIGAFLPPNAWWWLTAQCALLLATAYCWRRSFGRGPLERFIIAVTRTIVDAAPLARPAVIGAESPRVAVADAGPADRMHTNGLRECDLNPVVRRSDMVGFDLDEDAPCHSELTSDADGRSL